MTHFNIFTLRFSLSHDCATKYRVKSLVPYKLAHNFRREGLTSRISLSFFSSVSYKTRDYDLRLTMSLDDTQDGTASF